MVKFWLGIIIGILLGAGIMIAIIYTVIPSMLFKTSKSPHNFEKTIQQVEHHAKEQGWSVPNIYNLQATMEKHDFHVRPVTVFSMCKPSHAFKILSQDEERIVSTMMPCRLAVYEREDGSTYIAQINSILMSKLIGGLVKEVMTDASTETIEIIDKVIKEE
ncbi:DUF302 domain-containing protein [Puteibacter caeruleilacunae]|nr:DUF302 domain-containing protein [Puteibacter caeruleilacunae]